MVTTDISICNLALMRIGLPTIASFEQTTKEAKTCAAVYPFSLKAVLEDHYWGFAKKSAEGVVVDEDYLDWEFTYEYPSDCIAIRKIADPVNLSGASAEELSGISTNKIEYDLMVGGGDTASTVVVTNQEDAVIIYTALIENPALYTSLFVEALSYRVAADLAVPLRADSKLQLSMFNIYQNIINKAKASDVKQFYKAPEQKNSFTDARA